jgi:hypothetical protein
LTPNGIEEKARITARFLKRKVSEYKRLRVEIEQLRQEVRKNGVETTPAAPEDEKPHGKQAQ